MRSAYDEVMATGIKRQHEPPRIVGDLLSAEISEKQARSIKYQLTVAKLPLEFDFDGTPVNEALIRDLADGTFVADRRNAVLIGGTGAGKSHLAIGIARALIGNGSRGRYFFNVVESSTVSVKWVFHTERIGQRVRIPLSARLPIDRQVIEKTRLTEGQPTRGAPNRCPKFIPGPRRLL